MRMQAYCDVFSTDYLKRMSTEAHVYMRRHQGAKVKHFDVSNVICHKFSDGAAFYMLNVKNVNVILEWELTLKGKNLLLLEQILLLKLTQF